MYCESSGGFLFECMVEVLLFTEIRKLEEIGVILIGGGEGGES